MNYTIETGHTDAVAGISTNPHNTERLCTLNFLMGEPEPPITEKLRPCALDFLIGETSSSVLPSTAPPQQKESMLPFRSLPDLTRNTDIAPGMIFREAGRRWLDSKSIKSHAGFVTARYIRKNTEESYAQYIRTLELFFGNMPLAKIHLGHFAAYQQARLEGAEPFIRYRRPQDAKPRNGEPPKGKTPCPAKPKKVNQELGLLSQIMHSANCWTAKMKELYRPLLDEDTGEIQRALSPEEQRRWLEVSRSTDRWNVVHWYSLVAFSTCMSTDEIRGIRLGDINMNQRIIVIPRGKTKPRERTIELIGADVLWALERLIARAESLGAKSAAHYLFPSRKSVVEWDASNPMSDSGIKVHWNEIRKASGLSWFRQYDCRHTAITRMAEAGIPTDVIMAMAGHVSEKMRRHYTHISRSAMRHHVGGALPSYGHQAQSNNPRAYGQTWHSGSAYRHTQAPSLVSHPGSLNQGCGQ